MAQEQTSYPVQLSVDYPDRNLNRLTTFFRIIVIIPILVILMALSGAAELLFLAPLLMILFTGRYPRGMFDFVVGTMRWFTRVQAYAFLLTTDEYPPFRMGP